MIELRDIAKSFAGQELFSEGGVTIGKGEKIGLVGRNGSGKTTLLGIIGGTLEPDSGTVVSPKHYRIGYLAQTIAFTRPTVLAEACRGLPKSEEDQSWQAEKVLYGLGFAADDMERRPQEVSGGFQVRINLAKILLAQADILLLDEPNNYLDVVAVRWLIRFLRQWRGELVLITHERSFMDEVVTHIVGIHRKRLRKMSGTTGQFYQQIAQEEAIHENTRQRDERKRRHTEEFINKFRAKARQAGMAQSRLKALARMQTREKLRQIQTIRISFKAAPFHAGTMFTATNISFAYPERAALFEGISLRVGRRERLCVIGKNGKGKSTLLRVLAGELASPTGTIKPHPHLAVGYYAQPHVARLNSGRTVLEEIMSADPDGSPQRARSICGALLFGKDMALKPVSVLSGGEKSRVLMGKILMRPTQLLLLDEPTNHLDMESTQALCRALSEFAGSVVMVTHDEMTLERVAERLLVFDGDGARFFEGGYREFLETVGWQDEKDMPDASLTPRATQPAAGDRQLRKRQAARLRQERSRVLGPLEEEIRRRETRISELEEELRRVNRELICASQRADASAIAEYGRSAKKLPVEIEEEYGLLDSLLRKQESLAAEFALRLAEISRESEEHGRGNA